jgi:hypothetical protein
MLNKVSVKDILPNEEVYEFVQDLLDKHGDTEDQLMILLVKIATTKVILERALGLTEPVNAVLEDENDA